MFAHQVSSVSLVARIDTEKQTYLLDAAMQVVPSPDQAVNDEISPEDASREFAEGYLNVLFDDEEVTPELAIEVIDASDEGTPDELQRKEVVATMTGDIPAGAKEFLLYLDPACPMAVVLVAIKDGTPSRRMQVILAGEYSRAIDVRPVEEGDPFSAEESVAGKGETTKAAAEEEKKNEDKEDKGNEEKQEKASSAFARGWTAFFGVSLFPVLLPAAVFLLTLIRKPAFVQMAALMIGLSIGLSLSAWGAVGPAGWVAPLAAALGLVLAVESLFRRELAWWRVVLVGAAAFLAGWQIGLHANRDSLLAGVEPVLQCVAGAQAALVATALVSAGVLLFLSRFDWYRKGVAQPLAALLAAVFAYLVAEPFL